MRLFLYILCEFLQKKRKRLFFVSLFCFSFVAQMQAQMLSPGGVVPANAPLRLWLRSDVLINGTTPPADGGDVTSWRDFSFKSNAVYSSTSSQTSGTVWQRAPKYKRNSWFMNFNPAVSFDRNTTNTAGVGYQQFLGTSTRIMTSKTPAKFTVFVVANVDFNKVDNTGTTSSPERIAYFMGFGNDYISGSNARANTGATAQRAPAFGVTVDKTGGGQGRFYSYDTGDPYDGKTALFTAGSTCIAVYEVEQKQYIQYESDAYTERVDKTWGLSAAQVNNILSQSGINMNGKSMVGAGSRPSRNMVGDISEIIVYEGVLSGTEKNRIYTYLALRYGVTLKGSVGSSDPVGFNYFLSNNVPIWLGASRASIYWKYHHSIAALITDKVSGVQVTKSRSTNNGGFITIGLRDKSAPLENNIAIIWGHNGGSITKLKVPEIRCAPYVFEFNRVWMLDRTLTLGQDSGEKELVIKASTIDTNKYPFEGKGWDTYLLVADSETKANGKNWDLVIPATIQYDADNGIWEQVFNYKLGDGVGRVFFSIGGTQNDQACATCTFGGEDQLLIQKNNASFGGRVSLSGGQTLTRNNVKSNRGLIIMKVEFKAETGTTLSVDVPAVHDDKRPVHLKASGKAGAKSIITYIFNQPTNVEFTMGDIDQSEYVYIYGYCEDTGGSLILPAEVTQPELKGSYKRRGYSYNITNTSRMNGIGVQSAGRGNPRGKVNIRFGKAVRRVVIEYSSNRSELRWLDLYPLSFSCPIQLPPPNEAGYTFQKRGPQNLDICETADYTFTILNSNVDCAREPVHFTDYLPEGMYWVPGSLVIDGEDMDAAASTVMQDRMLDLSLLIRGSGKKTTFKAQAAFTDDAIAGDYYNGALTPASPGSDESYTKIDYTRRDNGLPGTLHSTDAYYTSGADRRTKTVVSGTKSYKNITTSMVFQPSACFRQNQEINVTVTIKNPGSNKKIESSGSDVLYFETYFNENCTYKPGTLFIDNVPVSDTASGVTIGTGDDNGIITLEGVSGFSLPAGGETTISYTIRVPDKDNLTYVTIGGKDEYDELRIGHALSMITSDICLQNAFLNALGEYAIGYCGSKGAIVSNRMTTSRLK